MDENEIKKPESFKVISDYKAASAQELAAKKGQVKNVYFNTLFLLRTLIITNSNNTYLNFNTLTFNTFR